MYFFSNFTFHLLTLDLHFYKAIHLLDFHAFSHLIASLIAVGLQNILKVALIHSIKIDTLTFFSYNYILYIACKIF